MSKKLSGLLALLLVPTMASGMDPKSSSEAESYRTISKNISAGSILSHSDSGSNSSWTPSSSERSDDSDSPAPSVKSASQNDDDDGDGVAFDEKYGEPLTDEEMARVTDLFGDDLTDSGLLRPISKQLPPRKKLTVEEWTSDCDDDSVALLYDKLEGFADHHQLEFGPLLGRFEKLSFFDRKTVFGKLVKESLKYKVLWGAMSPQKKASYVDGLIKEYLSPTVTEFFNQLNGSWGALSLGSNFSAFEALSPKGKSWLLNNMNVPVGLYTFYADGPEKANGGKTLQQTMDDLFAQAREKFPLK